MQPTKEKLEQLQTVLVKEYGSVMFYKRGTKPEDGCWYLTAKDFNQIGKQNSDGDAEFYRTKTFDDFIEFTDENEIVAVANLDGAAGADEVFEDWAHLARYVGVTDLVTVSTKVPKTIARKFEYYATKSKDTQSSKLRRLVYDYVISNIKENAEEDAVR